MRGNDVAGNEWRCLRFVFRVQSLGFWRCLRFVAQLGLERVRRVIRHGQLFRQFVQPRLGAAA